MKTFVSVMLWLFLVMVALQGVSWILAISAFFVGIHTGGCITSWCYGRSSPTLATQGDR